MLKIFIFSKEKKFVDQFFLNICLSHSFLHKHKIIMKKNVNCVFNFLLLRILILKNKIIEYYYFICHWIRKKSKKSNFNLINVI